jgi:CRP/FNR family transcriptional regulator
MTDYAIASTLKNCPLFRKLKSGHMTQLASIATRIGARKGRILFHQGDPAEEMFILSEGRVRLYKLAEDGKQQTIRLVEHGEVFAEAAMFAGESYPVYAEAITDSKLVSIPKSRIVELVAADPTFATSLIGNLARLLREVTDLVEELSLREVSSRLAKYLTELVEAAHEPGAETPKNEDEAPRSKGSEFEGIEREGLEIELTIPKSELSKKLGTSPETLSRTLRKLADKRILEVEGRTITIHRPDLLGRLASGSKISDL